MLGFDITCWMIGLGSSSHSSNSIRAKMKCCKSHDYFSCWVTNCLATRIQSSRITGRNTWSASGLNGLVGWFLWHTNFCRLSNAKSIFYVNNQFYFKQFSLAWVHNLIVKNLSFSSYSVYSNSSNSAYWV